MLKNNEESNGIMRIKLNSPSDDGINVEYRMRKSVKEQLNIKWVSSDVDILYQFNMVIIIHKVHEEYDE